MRLLAVVALQPLAAAAERQEPIGAHLQASFSSFIAP